MFFVVRTDADQDSGLQRVFAAYDTEADAVAAGAMIAAMHAGEFAVFSGDMVVRFDKPAPVVTAVAVG